MSYLSSGKFRTDLESVTGQKLTLEHVESNESLDGFAPETRAEVEALFNLVGDRAKPKLCVLTWGDFCPVPELTGEERDEVLEDWFDGDEKATDFVMSALDVVNGGGGFYVLVNTDGKMGLLCEDPHSFDPLECNLGQFFQALVAAHKAACTQGLDAAQAELMKVVDAPTAKLLLTFSERLTPGAS